MNEQQLFEKIREWYNGYRFSPSRNVKIYNPTSLMYLLSKGEFRNYWFETGTPTFFVKLIKERNYYIPELEHTEMVIYDIQTTFELENLDIVSLLYQTGYLTIEDVGGEDWVILNYPNREVRVSFSNVLMRGVFEVKGSTPVLARKLGKALYELDKERFDNLFNGIIKSIPNTLLINADEPKIHTIGYLSLVLAGYNARSEVLTCDGRIDIVIEFKDKIFVIEFKVNQAPQKGIERIKGRKYYQKYIGLCKEIYLVGINYDSERKIIRSLIEKFFR